jgi:hypothetical protein
MARGFRRKRGRFTASLSPWERALVLTSMEQTRAMLDARSGEPPADEFEAIMADAGIADAEPDAVGQAAPEPAQPDPDPAVRRLLPDGHREDPAVAAEFRRLTEEGLRQRKAATLGAAIEALSSDADREVVDLDRRQAESVLVALTDVRLVLGERLALRSDEDADALQGFLRSLGSEHPLAPVVEYYDFLTWLQETLAESLLREGR